MNLKTCAAAILMVLGGAAGASAGTFAPFTDASFEAAERGGGPIVVEVYAPWCPICARQQPILEGLESSPSYAHVTVLRVDFDSQKKVLQTLRVSMQSTLIGYHGTKETGRLIGVVKKPKIEELFASTLK